MPYAARTLSSPHVLTRAQKRTLKAAFIGLAYLAGVVVIVMAQITLDRIAGNTDPDQTSINARAD